MISPKKSLAAEIVAQSDVRAERLISVLRMGLAMMLFMGVSFILSQTEIAGLAERRTELVFLRIGAVAYFLLGALNFYFSAARRFKPWMSWAFNLAEVTIIAFQLYIDVADPQTPSLLAFASPAMLIVALVICVQALRSQLYLHMATSALLLILCGVILLHDPQTDMPMPDAALLELQVVYSLPPSIMRLVMLGAMATLIGAAVFQSRRLVERVARETETAENRKRFMPNEISDAMSDQDIDALRTGKEQNLAVVFIDIRGFTALAERLPPRETAELLGHFRGLITDETIACNGIVDKFIGDGALLIFGLHCDIGQATADALDAALRIQTATRRWNDRRLSLDLSPVHIAIGIHAGPAIVGAVGDDRRLEFTALGPTVNLASRLEEVAKEHDETLVISQSALALSGADMGRFRALGACPIRGSASPMELMALTLPG